MNIEFYLNFIVAALFMIVSALYYPHNQILAIVWSITSIVWMLAGIISKLYS